MNLIRKLRESFQAPPASVRLKVAEHSVVGAQRKSSRWSHRPRSVRRLFQRTAIWLLPIVLLLTGCTGEQVQTGVVAKGKIQEFVDEQAVTSLPIEHVVSMPFSGRIGVITLEEGDKVTSGPEGEPVALVDAEDLALEVAQAQAALDRLDASIAETKDTSVEMLVKQQADILVDSTAKTVEAASTRLTSSKAKLTYSQEIFDDVRELYQQNANTLDEFRRARLDYIEADVDHTTNVLTNAITDLMHQATKLTPQMVTQYINRKDLQVSVLEKQKAEADIKLRQAKLRQQRGKLLSPIDGVVLQKHVENEQFLAAGAPLVTVGDLTQLQVEAEVLSQDVVRVKVGDIVAIYGPAAGVEVEQAFAGKVSRISPIGEETTSSLGVQQQRVNVTIAFNSSELARLQSQRNVGVGYRVRVRIFTAENTDALIAPRSAFFRAADGTWRVYVVRQGKAVLTSVTVGLSNDEQMEVLEGLTAGDELILAPENTIRDGSSVKMLARES